jgi:hypothetical protein
MELVLKGQYKALKYWKKCYLNSKVPIIYVNLRERERERTWAASLAAALVHKASLSCL